MRYGENVVAVRKKGLSQDELAKKVGTISVTIGRYERNEIKPSIDVATKIADVLEESMDYLVGHSDTVLEKSLVKKISDSQKLPQARRTLSLLSLMLSHATTRPRKLLSALKSPTLGSGFGFPSMAQP